MLRAEQKLERLRELIECLKAGGVVTKRDMRAMLTAEELAAHEADWQSAKAFNDEYSTTPEQLKSYVRLLRRADAMTEIAERERAKGKSGRARQLGNEAQAAYERALENLAEALGVDAGLSVWLDRTVGDARHLTAEDVPRLRSGRSKYKQAGVIKTATIGERKLARLEAKLAELTETAKQKRKRQKAESAAAKKAQERLARLRKYL